MKTPTLDRHINAAVEADTDPVASARRALAELEAAWFDGGGPLVLRELRVTEATLERLLDA